MELVVGMGEYLVSNQEEDVLRTFSLASCVAVTVYSPIRRAAGMVHVVLPFPFDKKDKDQRPSYFAETGVPLLINTLCAKYACSKEELQIRIYGGADSMLEQDIFSIGKKNIEAVRDALSGMGLPIHAADLRGRDSRTIAMEVKTGVIHVFRQPIMK